jgi:hypothetical protein
MLSKFIQIASEATCPISNNANFPIEQMELYKMLEVGGTVLYFLENYHYWYKYNQSNILTC